MVELVTPLSVVPVSCPLPQGDGSVPNLAEEVVDAAPPTPGVTSTPAAVSVVSISAAPRARRPVTLFIVAPPVYGTRPRGPAPHPIENPRTRSCLGTLATWE